MIYQSIQNTDIVTRGDMEETSDPFSFVATSFHKAPPTPLPTFPVASHLVLLDLLGLLKLSLLNYSSFHFCSSVSFDNNSFHFYSTVSQGQE